MSDLVEALVDTGATIGFDATGGGNLSSLLLTAMEVAANKTATEYSRYGSDSFKQVYIYGGLDRSPTTLTRSFGFSWSLGGWLLTPFIGKIGPEKFQELRLKAILLILNILLMILIERNLIFEHVGLILRHRISM